MNGQSGLLVPGPVGHSQCPATGAATVLHLRLEAQPVPENRKYTTGSEFRSRDNPALSSPSVQSTVPGVPGQLGQTVMAALDHPHAPENVTVHLPGLVVCPVLEKAGRVVPAMTTSLSAQTVEEARKNGLVGNPVLAPVQISMVTQSVSTLLGAAGPAVVQVTWFCRMECVWPEKSVAANTTTALLLEV